MSVGFHCCNDRVSDWRSSRFITISTRHPESGEWVSNASDAISDQEWEGGWAADEDVFLGLDETPAHGVFYAQGVIRMSRVPSDDGYATNGYFAFQFGGPGEDAPVYHWVYNVTCPDNSGCSTEFRCQPGPDSGKQNCRDLNIVPTTVSGLYAAGHWDIYPPKSYPPVKEVLAQSKTVTKEARPQSETVMGGAPSRSEALVV